MQFVVSTSRTRPINLLFYNVKEEGVVSKNMNFQVKMLQLHPVYSSHKIKYHFYFKI